MMGESAVAARREGLLAAIRADATLGPMLRGEQIYVREAPENSPLPYVMLTQTVEVPRGYIMQPGQEGVEDMTLWHTDPVMAQEVYRAMYRLLNRRKISLTDHLQVYGTFSYLLDLPSSTRAAHGVSARWRARTINA